MLVLAPHVGKTAGVARRFGSLKIPEHISATLHFEEGNPYGFLLFTTCDVANKNCLGFVDTRFNSDICRFLTRATLQKERPLGTMEKQLNREFIGPSQWGSKRNRLYFLVTAPNRFAPMSIRIELHWNSPVDYLRIKRRHPKTGHLAGRGFLEEQPRLLHWKS